MTDALRTERTEGFPARAGIDPLRYRVPRVLSGIPRPCGDRRKAQKVKQATADEVIRWMETLKITEGPLRWH